MTEIKERPFTHASFNQFLKEGRLMGSRCTECSHLYLPPRAICPNCHGDQLTWYEFNGKGTLAAFTVVHIAPTFMVEAGYGRSNPYVSGVVELEEGVKISARILEVDANEPQNIRVGQALQLELTEEGEGEKKKTVLGFKPAP